MTACGTDAARGPDDEGVGGGGGAGASTAGTSGNAGSTAGSSAGAATSSGGATSANGGAPSSGGAMSASGGSVSAASGGVSTASGGTESGGSPPSGSGGAPSAGGTAGTGGALAGTGGAETGLPSGVTYLFPPPGGTGVCPDAPLRMRFAGAPALGSSGKVVVHDASGAVVASVDLAVATVSDTIGGTAFTLPRRAFVDGNDAVVYLKTKALAYGKSYYVTVEGAAITPPGGGSFTVADASVWRFTTKSAAPSAVSALHVALDGAGDFCTVQGALDALPASNTTPATITVAAGTYHEVVHSRGKDAITLHGADRKQTIVSGTNNNNLNPSTSTRSLVGFDDTKNLVIENLTIHNTTPQNGSQAEALRLQGCDQCVVRDADILSLQDTLLWSGRVYAKDCYIEGNVDYVWGTGIAYFDSCELRTVGRTGVIVQARNAAGAYGYVFVNSKLTADAAATGNVLARIDASAYPGSQVAYVNCEMQSIAPAGWMLTAGSATSSLRFWEYGSHDAAGNALDVSRRLAGSAQISASQATTLMSPSAVLGGWTPP
ncbi:MAG TPA: pectinesterase family protein [Polyangiaceae bacterium]|nr:pectinesterase family protein [Polyangiaceae bacterium]